MRVLEPAEGIYAFYVDEPEHFDVHLANLKRLRQLGADRILPNHGDPDVIAGGGYRPDLIDATEAYIRRRPDRAGEGSVWGPRYRPAPGARSQLQLG